MQWRQACSEQFGQRLSDVEICRLLALNEIEDACF